MIDIMSSDRISTDEKVKNLGEELAEHHGDETFLKCRNMGEILKKNLKVTLLKPMRRLEKEKFKPLDRYA
jgi:hypothetical protein